MQPYWYAERELTEQHKLLTLRYVSIFGVLKDFLERCPHYRLEDEAMMEQFDVILKGNK